MMAKNVIPEVVTYSCDRCKKEISKQEFDDFKLGTNETLRDYSGAAMNNHVEKYDLCKDCEKDFKLWVVGQVDKLSLKNMILEDDLKPIEKVSADMKGLHVIGNENLNLLLGGQKRK